MKRTFTAIIHREGEVFSSQCLEVDVASMGATRTEALANLKEALELHFEEPVATDLPDVDRIEVDIGAAWIAFVSRNTPQAP